MRMLHTPYNDGSIETPHVPQHPTHADHAGQPFRVPRLPSHTPAGLLSWRAPQSCAPLSASPQPLCASCSAAAGYSRGPPADTLQCNPDAPACVLHELRGLGERAPCGGAGVCRPARLALAVFFVIAPSPACRRSRCRWRRRASRCGVLVLSLSTTLPSRLRSYGPPRSIACCTTDARGRRAHRSMCAGS